MFVCEQGVVKVTASTKEHVCRVKMAANCAAVCPSSLAANARSTNVTTAVMASAFPAMVSPPQGNSPAGRSTETHAVCSALMSALFSHVIFFCHSCSNGRVQPSCYTCDTNEYCANGQCSLNPTTNLPECR